MLCHIIPRDNVMRFCVLLLCTAFILQAVGLGKRGSNGSCGTYYKADGTLLQMNPYMELTRADGTIECSNGDGSAPKCQTFVKYMRIAAGFAVAAFISTPIAMGVISAAIVPLASTTSKMVIGFYVSVTFPWVATMICTIVFFTKVVPEAGKPFGFDSASFERGVAINLYVASNALHCLCFLLATIRLMLLLILRPAEKREMVQSKNIDSIMVLHMVNDDWDRQKKVWQGHLECVQKALDDSRNGAGMVQRGPADDADETSEASQVLNQTVSTVDVAAPAAAGQHEPIDDDAQQQAQQQQQ